MTGELYRIALSPDEFLVIKDLVDPSLLESNPALGTVTLLIADSAAERLGELVQERYVRNGFDLDHRLTDTGLLLEAVVAKFNQIGW
jgi:hypothetical protein